MKIKAGDQVTICHYSDRHAWEVIRATAKRATLRRLKTTLLNGMDSNEPDRLVAHPGGFCAHVQGTQRYAYESVPDGHTTQIALHADGRWYQCSTQYPVVAGADEFYDYNF